MRKHDKGSALIIAMILMIVLAVVGLAIVNRTTYEVDAVASKRHYDRAVACAEGARQMLLSQFRAYGVNLSSLQLQKTVGDQTYASGHYDSFNITTVGEAPGTPGGIVGSDAANRITKRSGGLGGKGYRFSVVCSDSAAPTHQMEVEFLVNFGF
ncbi:MAG: hypothetical protein E6J78_04630 [Deltaproteobacteria bacterium]|nr:MAG: hypothetical protein E6J78_04630 [Deltaproteobacteria bacterium]